MLTLTSGLLIDLANSVFSVPSYEEHLEGGFSALIYLPQNAISVSHIISSWTIANYYQNDNILK